MTCRDSPSPKGVSTAAVLAAVAWGLLAALPAGPACAQEATAAEGTATGARIVISLADRRLYLTGPEGGTRSFPVAVGRPGVPIPTGDSRVVRKRRNPTWHPTAHQRRDKPSLPPAVPPGSHNPLGRFALDLGWPAIAIHGTNEPDSVGRQASGGCFRMLPADIETVFAATTVGTPVRVVRASLATPGMVQPPTAVADAPVPSLVQPAPPANVASVAAVPPTVVPLPAAAPLPPPEPIPDPRCGSVTAPLRRMICDTPALALLDGRARGVQERFLAGLADPSARAAAAYALIQDERRFHERVSALCWIRSGSETDPAVAVAARSCLSHALDQRLADVAERIAGLNGGTRLASRP